MEGIPFAVMAALLVLTFSIEVQGNTGSIIIHQNCSNYTLHLNSEDNSHIWYAWSDGIQLCEKTGSHLVSIESKEEWSFLKQTIQTEETIEYFVGLRKDETSGELRWISDNSKVNATKKGNWPWAHDQPGENNEDCVVMYKDYGDNYGLYNNVWCDKKSKIAGYICERALECNGKEDVTTEPVIIPQTTAINTESSTGLPTIQTMPVTKAIHSILTTQIQSTDGFSTTVIHSRVIPTENIVNNSLTEKAPIGGSNLIVTVLAILALLILVILIVLGVLFLRRRRSFKKQDNRVRCTYKKSSSPGQQSTDHVQLESSAELTVHVTLSRTETGLATHETVNDCREECAYATVDKTNRKSRSNREEDEAEKKAQSDDGYCIPSEHLSSMLEATKKFETCGVVNVNNAEQEENKDHVYAAVQKVGKDRVRGASFHATAQRCSLTDGIPAEPVNRWSSVMPGNRSSSVVPVNRSSLAIKRGMNTDEATAEETLAGGEGNDYLYAVVDKANKKRGPPQMPLPYRGIVYADLNHSPANNARPVKTGCPTVYADIDHV